MNTQGTEAIPCLGSTLIRTLWLETKFGIDGDCIMGLAGGRGRWSSSFGWKKTTSGSLRTAGVDCHLPGHCRPRVTRPQLYRVPYVSRYKLHSWKSNCQRNKMLPRAEIMKLCVVCYGRDGRARCCREDGASWKRYTLHNSSIHTDVPDATTTRREDHHS